MKKPKPNLLIKNFSLFRRSVQAVFALTCLLAGWQFYHFHQWAIGNTEIFTPRPPSVEAFLPIGALVSFKRLLLTGIYDDIHPAGLTIFIAALTIAFLLRKGFCGWICPIGFLSNLVELAGRKLKIIIRVPALFDIPLLTLKYLLLSFFGFLILIKMDLKAIEGFMRSPYNIIVDAKMLYFFLSPSNLTLWITGFLIVISFFIRNFWCRYLCPYGALLGILSPFSPSNVRRDVQKCIDCKKCEKVCPGAITITEKAPIRVPECIGCLECVSVCPVDDCLTVVTLYKKRVKIFVLPALVIAFFLGFWLTASATGHWHNQMPKEVLKRYYGMGTNIAHPR